MQLGADACLCTLLQYYAFVEEKQKVHCLNTLFSKVRLQSTSAQIRQSANENNFSSSGVILQPAANEIMHCSSGSVVSELAGSSLSC